MTVLGCRFRQNYASSETGPLPITSLPPEDHDPARGRLGTAGRPSLGWEVRLGERGEIQVRGAAPLPGYWNDPEATARSLTADGFYRTGDVGTLGADGYLTIVDRLSDLVITGGENVYPAEVEAVLAGHPAVADVAVIGVPDERWGETVHAVVVLAPGARRPGDTAPGDPARGARGTATPSPGSTRPRWSAGRASGWPGSSARPASRSSPSCRATRPARCCGPRCASLSGPAATGWCHDRARPARRQTAMPARQCRPAGKGHPQGPADRRGLPRGGPARVRPRRLPQRQDQRHRRGGRPVGRVLLQLLRHQGGPAHRAGRGIPRRSLPAGRPAVPGRAVRRGGAARGRGRLLAHLRQAARRADRHLPGGHGRGPLPGPLARAARRGHHPDRHRRQEGPGGRLLPGRRSGHDGLGPVGHAGALLLHLARAGRREGRAVRRRPGAGRPVHDLGEGRLLARPKAASAGAASCASAGAGCWPTAAGTG